MVILIFTLLFVGAKCASLPADQEASYPVTEDCSRYTWCSAAFCTVRQCPPHHVFHVTGAGEGKCVHDKVQYQACALLHNDHSTFQTSENRRPDTLTPFVCPRDPTTGLPLNGFHGDGLDCERFYLCIDGRKFAYHCPAGHYWSQLTRFCDIPARATCPRDGSGDLVVTGTRELTKRDSDLGSGSVESSGDGMVIVVHWYPESEEDSKSSMSESASVSEEMPPSETMSKPSKSSQSHSESSESYTSDSSERKSKTFEDSQGSISLESSSESSGSQREEPKTKEGSQSIDSSKPSEEHGPVSIKQSSPKDEHSETEKATEPAEMNKTTVTPPLATDGEQTTAKRVESTSESHLSSSAPVSMVTETTLLTVDLKTEQPTNKEVSEGSIGSSEKGTKVSSETNKELSKKASAEKEVLKKTSLTEKGSASIEKEDAKTGTNSQEPYSPVPTEKGTWKEKSEKDEEIKVEEMISVEDLSKDSTENAEDKPVMSSTETHAKSKRHADLEPIEGHYSIEGRRHARYRR